MIIATLGSEHHLIPHLDAISRNKLNVRDMTRRHHIRKNGRKHIDIGLRSGGDKTCDTSLLRQPGLRLRFPNRPDGGSRSIQPSAIDPLRSQGDGACA
ncbi:MAG TPA: hypothetical protein VN961_20260, partial [Streptosporangiaceae bacterium]|nr:hypothetical protein [Streptosporangiaceae bacterium]